MFARSLNAGNGTAAGDAWPLFGIISGALALAVTSTAALILGAISIVLFVFIFIPVAYISYKNYLKELNETQKTLKIQRHNIVESLYDYLLTIKDKCTKGKNNLETDKLIEAIKIEIAKDIKLSELSDSPLRTQLLQTIKNNTISIG